MATYQKRGQKWRAIVRKAGITNTKTFTTKSSAQAWARGIEHGIDKGEHPGSDLKIKFGELIGRYVVEQADSGILIGRTKRACLEKLQRDLGHVRLAELNAQTIIGFARKRRNEGAGGVTVAMDITYIKTVLLYARGAWAVRADIDAVRDARAFLSSQGIVSRSTERDRRPTQQELDDIRNHFLTSRRQIIPMADIVDFAVASAMRLSEIAKIRWSDLDVAKRTVIIRQRKHPKPLEKANNDQEVPLLPAPPGGDLDPLEVIQRQPRTDDPRIFPFDPASVSTAFTRACKACGTPDLRFHDLRHEGVSRLFERGLSIERAAMISGHRDWKMLKRYVNLRPGEVVAEVIESENKKGDDDVE